MQITSDAEYELALKRIDELWGAAPRTPQGDELGRLFNAVEEYEEEHYPIDEPKSYAAIQFHLERLNWTLAQLPLSQDEIEMLAYCIDNGVLVPERLVEKMSHLLGVPREVLGDANQHDLIETLSPQR